MASYCLDTPVFDFALPRRKRRAPLDAVIAVRANGVATVNQVHGRPTAIRRSRAAARHCRGAPRCFRSHSVY
ncbi:hypothetical protein [Burkholderia thailandensis]|uniref:hypothetical protein n=1 Tax=Burkholderia thailandensis TaxID=57975 RepID=UPI00016A5C39|nr:hypothetical protein [Burkholderia thailandensis]AVR09626.1 hypothetical protein A8H31_19710 [Burkholderia thailandensis]AVR24306.1 hypothetical protein A8H32_03470 [Burkholderia thailandensis]AWY57653.1 hypothetical protein A8H35_03525 [Burkholderia thailandensis]AWY68180.1 hypothetical protein A8H36_24785 [Burkholderia thailandensis]MDD1480052.1 hypothetical protein [Burkholderia thailandensis]